MATQHRFRHTSQEEGRAAAVSLSVFTAARPAAGQVRGVEDDLLSKPSICFCAPMARGVFEPETGEPFGGSEVRAYLFATGLAQYGWRVDAVIDSHDRSTKRDIDGIGLHYHRLPTPMQRTRNINNPIRRLVYWPGATVRRLYRSLKKRLSQCLPSVTSSWQRVTDRVEVDWFACFGVHWHAATVIRRAADRGRRSVLFLASDSDLDASYDAGQRDRTNAYGQTAEDCRLCLQHASLIIAQTRSQQTLLRRRFGRDAVVIRNPYRPITDVAKQPRRGRSAPIDVLWVGRADCFSKRADIALKLASACPHMSFTLVMNRRDPGVFRQLTRCVPNNATIVSHVPWQEMDSYYGRSRVLLNTSEQEGFPNAFLQAAHHGVAIVSRNVDPDGMLTRHECGRLVGDDLSRLAATLRASTGDCQWVQRARTAGPTYVATYHDWMACCHQLSAALHKASLDLSSQTTQPANQFCRPLPSSA